VTDRNTDIVCSYCLRYLYSVSAAAPLDTRMKMMRGQKFCNAKCRKAYKENGNEPKGGYRK
jgi:hypothetical protein